MSTHNDMMADALIAEVALLRQINRREKAA
jgi:hypothetical protein